MTPAGTLLCEVRAVVEAPVAGTLLVYQVRNVAEPDMIE